jgi:methyl-accepting chemotaxis protein
VATKKAKTKDLSAEMSTLSDRIGEVSTALERAGGIIQKLEQVAALMDLMVKRTEDIKNFLGRVVAPTEAMNAMTGELRALRRLLDTRGEYIFLDKAIARTEKAALSDPEPLTSAPTPPK